MLAKTKLADEVVAYGRSKHRGYKVYEGWGTINEETYKDGWWMFPLDCTQKTRADNRINDLRNQGYIVQQVIIAHEAPRLLCGPKTGSPVKKGKLALWVATGLLASVGTVAVAVAVTYILMLLLVPILFGLGFVLLMGLGLLIDPKAIVVLSDGSRVEVMSWVE